METLTAQQTKMVLEYFAQQAAEDAPMRTTDWKVWDRHLWMTRYQASVAIERQIKDNDWDVLVNRLIDLQSFDRDPAGYLHESGFDDDERHRLEMDAHLKEQVSWGIDSAQRNSGA